MNYKTAHPGKLKMCVFCVFWGEGVGYKGAFFQISRDTHALPPPPKAGTKLEQIFNRDQIKLKVILNNHSIHQYMTYDLWRNDPWLNLKWKNPVCIASWCQYACLDIGPNVTSTSCHWLLQTVERFVYTKSALDCKLNFKVFWNFIYKQLNPFFPCINFSQLKA